MLTEILFVTILSLAPDDSLSALIPPTLSTPQNGATGLPTSKLKLSWLAVPGAESYTVELSTDPRFENKMKLEKSLVEPAANRADLDYTVTPTKPAKLQPSTQYFWRVTANCPQKVAGCRAATSESWQFRTKFATSFPFLLTQTVDGEGAKKPAQFKYAHSIEKGTVASADFALQWRGHEHSLAGHHGILGLAYLEGVIKSNSEPADTAVRPAVGFVHDVAGESWSLSTLGVVSHESDQRFHTRKLLSILEGTPSYDAVAMGTALPRDSTRDVQFLWQPTLGITYGRTLAAGDSVEAEDTVERYSLQVDCVVFLNSAARSLNLREVRLSVSDKGWLLPLERERKHNLVSASLSFPVAEKVSVGLAFKHGRDAPEFKGTHDYGLTVGVLIGR